MPVLTITIMIANADDDSEAEDLCVNVEYNKGEVNRGLVIRHLAEEVHDIFSRYLKNGKVIDTTIFI